MLKLLRRLLGASDSTSEPAPDFLTVVYTTRDKYAGMTDEEIAYHRDNRVGR